MADDRIMINRQKDYDGTFLTGMCKCGNEISSYIQRGMPNQDSDLDCETCGRTYNAFGQPIAFKHGQGFDYAGEREDEDD
jgi:hypothetical protein